MGINRSSLFFIVLPLCVSLPLQAQTSAHCEKIVQVGAWNYWCQRGFDPPTEISLIQLRTSKPLLNMGLRAIGVD